MFTKARGYGILLYVSRYPILLDYLYNVISRSRRWIESNMLFRIVISVFKPMSSNNKDHLPALKECLIFEFRKRTSLYGSNKNESNSLSLASNFKTSEHEFDENEIRDIFIRVQSLERFDGQQLIFKYSCFTSKKRQSASSSSIALQQPGKKKNDDFEYDAWSEKDTEQLKEMMSHLSIYPIGTLNNSKSDDQIVIYLLN